MNNDKSRLGLAPVILSPARPDSPEQSIDEIILGYVAEERDRVTNVSTSNARRALPDEWLDRKPIEYAGTAIARLADLNRALKRGELLMCHVLEVIAGMGDKFGEYAFDNELIKKELSSLADFLRGRKGGTRIIKEIKYLVF
ncbi:MAG: hypothetical protein OEY44_00305 [Candidatus Peregrinibacteria bacterium]|nr:hypothetical protein [Candidatus Peregrinibacteria bacterium]